MFHTRSASFVAWQLRVQKAEPMAADARCSLIINELPAYRAAVVEQGLFLLSKSNEECDDVTPHKRTIVELRPDNWYGVNGCWAIRQALELFDACYLQLIPPRIGASWEKAKQADA